MNQFSHLFEPIRIGKQTVKNRIFMPPLSTNLAERMGRKRVAIENELQSPVPLDIIIVRYY